MRNIFEQREQQASHSSIDPTKNPKSVALWFSPNEPTYMQKLQITKSFNLVAVDKGMSLAKHPVKSEKDVTVVFSMLVDMICTHQAEAVFGIIPVYILENLAQSLDMAVLDKQIEDFSELVPFYSQWDVTPTIVKWCHVGSYFIESDELYDEDGDLIDPEDED